MKEIISLHGEVIEMDCLINRPHGITCLDSLLIFFDNYDKKMITVYDKKNKNVIGRYVSSGNGPDEAISPLRGLLALNHELITFEAQQGNMVAFDIRNNMRVKQKLRFDEKPLELRKMNGYYIGTSRIEGRFQLYDFESNLLQYAGEYPFNKGVSGIELSFLYQGQLCAFFEKNRFAFGCLLCDDIEFYEVEENNVKQLKLYSTTDINAQWVNNRVEINNDCIINYTSSYGTENFCYMLYSGKSMIDNGGPVLGQYIIVFDWGGNYQKTFGLDFPVTSFCVDEEGQYIYATAYLDSELSIMKFAFTDQKEDYIDKTKAVSSLVTDVSISENKNIFYQGIILDENTQKPLPNVRITVNSDTIGIESDKDGKFELTVNANDKLWFRHHDFLWKSLKVSQSDIQTIYLTTSRESGISITIPGEITEIIFNGWFVPKDEWKNIPSEEIGEVSLIEKEGKIQLIIEGK